jgi:hypothetical protein
MANSSQKCSEGATSDCTHAAAQFAGALLYALSQALANIVMMFLAENGNSYNQLQPNAELASIS